MSVYKDAFNAGYEQGYLGCDYDPPVWYEKAPAIEDAFRKGHAQGLKDFEDESQARSECNEAGEDYHHDPEAARIEAWRQHREQW